MQSVLTFAVRADTAAAEGSVKRLGAAMGEMGDKVAGAGAKADPVEQKFLRLAKSLGIETSGAAQKMVSQLEDLQKHLVSTNAPAADLERVSGALGRAQERLAESLKGGASAAASMGATLEKQIGFWEKHGAVVTGAAAAMGGALIAFGVQAVKAFSESQVVGAKLDAVLAATGRTTDGTREQVLKLSDALSQITPFDDEVITSGQTLLLTFKGISQDILPRATKAMLDLATATGQDVPAAAKMLGKALDQPSEGFGALAKAVGKFSESEVLAIKSMDDMGQTAAAQSLILDKLEGKFGGIAEGVGKTLPGQLQILRTELGNMSEDIGGKVTPSLEGLIQAFPSLALVAVAAHDSFSGLNVSMGELLIAIPLLKTAFTGAAGSLAAIGTVAGTVGAALVGLAAAGATITAAVAYWQAAEEQLKNMGQAGQMAQKATQALSAEAAKYGIVLQKGSETQEQFNARLQKSITDYEALHPEVRKAAQATQQHQTVIKSHVLTLQQQIEAQKALLERLKFTEGASEKLTQETAKLEGMLKKAGEGARQAEQKFDAYAKTLGTTAHYRALFDEEVKLFDMLKQHPHTLADLEKGSDKVRVAYEKWNESAKTSIQRFSEMKDPVITTTGIFEDQSKRVGKLASDFRDLDQASHDYMLRSGQSIATLAGDWNHMLDVVGQTPTIMKPAQQSFTTFGELAKRQVSTLVSDVSKGFADILFSAGSLGSKLMGTFKNIGQGIAQAFFESGILGLLTGQGLSGFSGFAGGVIKSITGKGGGAAGAASQGLGLAGAGAGLLGGASLFGSAGTAASLVPAGSITGLGALTTGGTAATGGLMGSLGALFTNPWTIGIGAALAGGLVLTNKFTQRGRDKVTATGSLESGTGAVALSNQVWQGIIPDVESRRIGVDEGLAQLNAAWSDYVKFLNDNLKDQVVIQRSIDTQRITLTEGTAALEALRTKFAGEDAAAKAEFEARMEAERKAIDKFVGESMHQVHGFLNEISFSGGVSDEVLTNLRDIAERVGETGREAETSAAKLAALGAEFFRTGKMTSDFSAALQEAGASPMFFTRITDEIGRLQGLRSELGGLKEMIDSLLPKQKTWQQQFFETGEITEEMGRKIAEAGGDIEQFKKFAEMKGVKSQFQSLVDQFNKTGVASDQLLEMIKKFGGSQAAGAFEELMAQAKLSGKSIGELAKGSEASAKVIDQAFKVTGAGIDNAFTDAAKQLSDTLAKMDENLGKAIGSLQTAMVTMIQNLIDVLLGVPGAAEKAARDANFFLGGIKAPDIRINISTHFDDSGLREAERRSATLAAINPTRTNPTPPGGGTTSGGGDRGSRDDIYTGSTPRMAAGGIVTSRMLLVDPATGLKAGEIGEGGPEAVVPIRPASGSSGGTTGGAPVNITINVSGADPDGLRKVTEEQIAPYLIKMIDNTRGGARAQFLKALRLKEPGSF